MNYYNCLRNLNNRLERKNKKMKVRSFVPQVRNLNRQDRRKCIDVISFLFFASIFLYTIILLQQLSHTLTSITARSGGAIVTSGARARLLTIISRTKTTAAKTTLSAATAAAAAASTATARTSRSTSGISRFGIHVIQPRRKFLISFDEQRH